MNIGTDCGAPFMGLADVIGRRGINFLGNAIVIFAAILQSRAINLHIFIAGRFFMGFGTALMSSSQYIFVAAWLASSAGVFRSVA